MRRRILSLAAAALLGVGLPACRGDVGGARRERVVGVSKQLNEFLYAIGAGDVLVARDLTSVYPPAVRALPSVGYHRALSAEGIAAARPTLVLTDGNVGPDAVLAQVKSVGIPVVDIRPGPTLDGAERAMAEFVLAAVANTRRVADLFCGAGAFSFRLAEAAQVLAFDADPAAVRALRAGAATAPGLKPVAAAARDLYRSPLPAEELNRVDAVVFDPPRAGALDQAREIARSKLATAVGVSCNPATFARDARALADGGFKLARVLPVDQFLWSPHIELVGVFER